MNHQSFELHEAGVHYLGVVIFYLNSKRLKHPIDGFFR